MAWDQSGGGQPSAEERAAGEQAGRKRLGADGRPQPAPGRSTAEDRRQGTPDRSPGSNARAPSADVDTGPAQQGTSEHGS